VSSQCGGAATQTRGGFSRVPSPGGCGWWSAVRRRQRVSGCAAGNTDGAPRRPGTPRRTATHRPRRNHHTLTQLPGRQSVPPLPGQLCEFIKKPVTDDLFESELAVDRTDSAGRAYRHRCTSAASGVNSPRSRQALRRSTWIPGYTKGPRGATTSSWNESTSGAVEVHERDCRCFAACGRGSRLRGDSCCD
jgi:hypothetical protein